MTPHDNQEEFADPVNYDLEQAPLSQSRIAFWRRIAAQFGGPVLDLCCGTGLVALPVAAQGLSVTGVDLAGPMLAWARTKGEQAGLDIRWVAADVRGLALGRRFGTIILTGNAFQAFLGAADQQALLATVGRHLAPEGVFGFETRNLAGHALRDEPEGAPEIDYVDADGHRVLLSSSQRWDGGAAVMHWTTTRRWTDAQGPRTRTTRIACRFSTPDEVEDLLEAAGLEVVARYGDWDFGRFRPDGERLVTLCRLRAGA